MKNAKVDNKKIIMESNPRRVAGMKIRSGVKAGFEGIDRDPRQRMTSPLDGPGRPG